MKRHHQIYILLILSIVFIPAAYVFAAAVFVVHISKGECKVLNSIKSNSSLVVVFIYIVIGIVFSKYILISFLYGIMMFLCLYSIGLSSVYMEQAYLQNLKKIIYLVSLVVFIIGIMQYLNPDFVMPKKWADIEEFKLKKRIYSTFFNPNVFGFYINIVIIVACENISIRSKSNIEKIVFASGIVCLFLTFSRTAWLSLIISLIISGCVFNKKYFKFALIISLIILGSDKALNIGRSDPSKVIEDTSILYRFEIWKACFKIISDNVITGIGFGTLFKYITAYSDTVKSNIEHCHNIYIQILTETGVIGFSGFLFILYNLIGSLWVKARRNRNNKSVVTSFTIIVMVMIHGTVDSVFLTPQIMMILSIYAGVMSRKERTLYAPKDYKNFSFITFQ